MTSEKAVHHARWPMLAIALVACLPGGAVAQAEWTTRFPPEQVLQFQPHTAREFMSQSRLLFAVSPSPADAACSRGPIPFAALDDNYARWSEFGAPVRSGHKMVFDSRRNRILLLGGRDASDPQSNVWSMALPRAEWTRISALPWRQPGEWAGTAMIGAVYDSLRDRLLVLHAKENFELDALSLSGSPEWIHLWTGPPTAERSLAGVALDTRRDQLVLLGVWDAPARAHRVIRVQLGEPPLSYTSVLASGPQPVQAWSGSAVYDASRDVFYVLFDVSDSGQYMETQLRMIAAEGTPVWSPVPCRLPDRGAPRRIALDAAKDRLLAYYNEGQTVCGLPLGGGNVEWLTIAPSVDRYAAAVVFDPVLRRLCVEGGTFGSDQCMAQYITPVCISATVDSTGSVGESRPPTDGAAAWIPAGDPGVGSRLWHSLRIDAATSRLVMFGACNWFGGVPGTYARPLSGAGGWEALGVASDSLPRVRFAQSIALSDDARRLVLYGGQSTDGTGDLLGDLWVLSLEPGGKWQRYADPGTGPGPRRGGAFVYERARSRFLLVGGDDLHQALRDAWELRFEPEPVWRRLTVLGTNPGHQSLFVDDARGDAWSVFFAYAGSAPARHVVLGDDTLAYEDRTVSGTPPIATPALAGFDPVRSRLLWLGGNYSNENSDLGALWSTSLGPDLNWQALPTAGVCPTWRGYMGLSFDPSRSALLLVGGYRDNSEYFADTWSLNLAEQPTAVTVSLVRVVSGAAGVRIEWQAAGGTQAAGVERSTDGVEWSPAGVATPVGAERYEFTCDGPAPGSRMAFRLLVPDGVGVVFSAPVWVEGAARSVGLAIVAECNPASGAPAFRLALAADAPARVRLLDVGGRVMGEGSVPAGTQRWTSASAVPPGLYFAELRQRGERRVARVVVAP